jgi:hypothetical protein
MIVHVVLYEMRPELDDAERDRLQRAVLGTFERVPSLRRWMVGRRTMLGVTYEALMAPGFGYAAVLEFDDLNALRSYLEHPAHAELSALFWSCSARTLVFDYEIIARA